jgi:hypothetical protein
VKTSSPLIALVVFAVSTLLLSGYISISSANPSPVGLSIKHGFVRSNGEIEPPTLPIQRIDNRYILTDNIVNYTLEIQRSNIVLDGAGFTIQGVYALKFDALTLSNINNVTIKNLKLNLFMNGIVLNNTSHIDVTNNRIDAQTCVTIDNVYDSDISGNTFSGKGFCIQGQGTNNIINYNYIEGRAVGLILSNGNNITNNLIKTPVGTSIQLGGYNEPCINNIISDNTIIIDDPSGVPSGIGIFDGSSNNQVFKNKITGCYSSFIASSIIVSNSRDNIFYENSFANSQYGVYVDGKSASMEAVDKPTLSINNTFFSNNFLNVSKSVQINNNASVNNWDNGSIGNYWSDYLTKYPQAKEIGNSAIGDTPYNLNVNNTDNYPLISQVNIVFSATLPSPIPPPITITINDPTANPTTSLPISTSSPEPRNPMNADDSPTTTPITNPKTSGPISDQFFLIALLSGLGLVAIILTVGFYKKGKKVTDESRSLVAYS